MPTRGRRRQVDTSTQFCPNPDCAYRGWVGWGNLRANGHPNGGPWRQLLCIACRRYFLESLGTIFHGKRASVDLIVRVIACLAEGLGIRGTARVFEVDPNTVLQWLVEAAEQLQAFSRHVLRDVRVRQVQLDELFALLSAVQAGEVSAAEAIVRLERTPQWVWVAMDPESNCYSHDVGDRTLAMAQRVVHQVTQVVAPDCAPLFLTDGFREYLTALLTHYGHWVQPPRRQATARPQAAMDATPTVALRASGQDRTSPAPGTGAAPCGVWHPGGHQSVLAPMAGTSIPPSWSGSTSPSASMSPRSGDGSARCARAKTGCGSRLAVYHCYYNFCLPHASVRQPLPQPSPPTVRA